MDPDTGGPKTYGSYGFGFGSESATYTGYALGILIWIPPPPHGLNGTIIIIIITGTRAGPGHPG